MPLKYKTIKHSVQGSSSLNRIKQAQSLYLNFSFTMGVTTFYMDSEFIVRETRSKFQKWRYLFTSSAVLASSSCSSIATFYNMINGHLQLEHGIDIVIILLGFWHLLAVCVHVEGIVSTSEITGLFNSYNKYLTDFQGTVRILFLWNFTQLVSCNLLIAELPLSPKFKWYYGPFLEGFFFGALSAPALFSCAAMLKCEFHFFSQILPFCSALGCEPTLPDFLIYAALQFLSAFWIIGIMMPPMTVLTSFLLTSFELASALQ